MSNVPETEGVPKAASTHKEDIERKASLAEDVSKGDQTQYHKIDKELAKYAGGEAIHISPEESTRLRKMIDKRVLLVMILTYFLQAIDKGTLSFAYVVVSTHVWLYADSLIVPS